LGQIKLPKKSIEFFEKNYPEIFDTGNLAEGIWNEKVSSWCKSYTQSPYSLAFNSNGSGLFTILRLLKRYRSKEDIFLQSNTMYGVKTIALASGLNFMGFVDCSLDYLMPTADQVRKFINKLENPHKSVFLITHIGGWVNPEIEEISEICKKNKVELVEDCAHSLGSLLNNDHSGLYGLAGVYSLYATKAVPAGEGGIMVTKDEELYEMCRKFIMYDRFDQEIDVGVNLRMSEINALICYSVLEETESIIENKYLISDEYRKICIERDIRFINPSDDDHRSNLYKFIILARSESDLKKFNLITNKTSCVYDYSLGDDKEGIAKKHVCLPIWYKQEEEKTLATVEELSNIFSK